MLRRLRVRFVCINMAIVTVMLCVLLGMVLHFTRANLEEQSVQMVRSIATEPLFPGGKEQQQEWIGLPYFILQLDYNGNIKVYSNDDTIMYNGDVVVRSSGNFDLTNGQYLRELVSLVNSSGSQSGVLEEYSLRFYRAANPTGLRIVFADISSEIRVMDNLIRDCVLIGIAGFVLFLVMSLFLARWAVRPVEKAWNQQRQFVADASHELKTPLTVIMTNAELLQSPEQDEESRSRFAASILTMSHQMRGLVEGLLELARIDNGAIRQSFTEVDLSQLADNAILSFEAVFFEKELILSDEIDSGIRVRGSERHLRQVLDILLDNAQKYSHPHTEVLVTLRRAERGHCLLSVANIGDPIGKEDLTNIFKRFYRADKARSRDGSYGLGLSIAESIVRDHQGRIWAESKNGINRFYVQLPAGG